MTDEELADLYARSGGGPQTPAVGAAPQSAAAAPASGAVKGQPSWPGSIADAITNDSLVYGVKHGWATLGTGAQGVMNGLDAMFRGQGYDAKVQGARDFVLGVTQMGFSPFTVPWAQLRKTIEKSYPELANSDVALDPRVAGFLRTMLGNVPQKVSDEKFAQMTPEQQQAYKQARDSVNQPFTFGEAIETAGTLATPVVLGYAMRKAQPAETAPAKPGGKAPAAETAVAESPKALTEGAAIDKVTPEHAQAFVDSVNAEPPPPVPPPGTEGPRAFGVNWQRLGQEESVNRVILQVNKELAGEGKMPATEGALVPTTAADVTVRAKTLGVTLDDVMQLPNLPDRVTSLEQLDAFTAGVRGVRDAVTRVLKHEADMVAAGDESARQNVQTLLGMARQAATADKLTGENVAQALSARRMPSDLETSGTGGAQMYQLLDRINGMTDIDRAAEMISALPGGQSRLRRFVDNVGNAAATGKDILWEVWVNDLLGPATAGAKAVGDLVMLSAEGPQRTLARWNQQVFPWLFRDETGHLAPGEGSTFAMAAAEHIPTAVMQAIRGARAGEVDIMTAIGEDRPYANKLSGENLGLTPGSLPAILADGLGAVIRLPGTTLGVITRAAKAANYAGASAAGAVRQAWFEGHRGEAANRRIQYVMEHPAKFPWIADEALRVSQENTFTNDLGRFGKSLTETLNTAHLRSQAPFLRIPINLEKTATQLIPPFNIPSLLWGELRRDLEMGGETRARAMANVEFGALMAATVASLTAKGIITGYGPRNPGLQKFREEAGTPSHSIMIGDQAYDYNRFKPVGTMIGLTATATEAWAQLPNDADAVDRAGQIALIHALSWGRVIQDASYFTGVKQIVDAISAGDKTVAGAARASLNSMARSTVPNTWARTPNRLFLDNIMREAHTAQDAFLAGVPGYSTDLPPHRDQLKGNPMEYPAAFGPSIISPIPMRAVNPDPVAKMLWDNQISWRPLPWSVDMRPEEPMIRVREAPTGSDVTPLTGWQRDRWHVLMYQETRIAGRTLYESLEHMMTLPKFQTASNGPGGAKENEVLNVVHGFQEKARAQLLAEDQQLKLVAAERQRARVEGKWLPTTNPRSPQYGGKSQAGGGLQNILDSLGR